MAYEPRQNGAKEIVLDEAEASKLAEAAYRYQVHADPCQDGLPWHSLSDQQKHFYMMLCSEILDLAAHMGIVNQLSNNNLVDRAI